MERNLLTEKLLAEGYTKDNHPDYVKWYGNMDEFEYTSEFLRSSTWEAPCGIMRKGEFTHGYGWINGVCWRVENNNYNFHCPYRKKECEHFHPLLKDIKAIAAKCSWQLTDKPYDYDNSAEKIEDERRALMRENLVKKFGHPSMIHCACCHIDDETCEVYFKFDPHQCIDFTHNGCDNAVCHCTGKERNLKKGNIYYDVKVTTEYKEGFIHEDRISITKGKKLFEAPKAMTDLELYLKAYPDAVMDKERGRNEHSKPLFMAEYRNGPKYAMEVINVRIESRPGRDLMQDLSDIKEGITITHESDKAKDKKEQKKQRCEASKNNKITRLETKILKLGFANLEEADKRRARKFIDRKRVMDLEWERLKPKPVEPEKPKQEEFLIENGEISWMPDMAAGQE